MLYTLDLPICPQPTPRARVARWGAYYPKKYQQYKSELKRLVTDRWGGPKFKTPVSCRFVFYIPKPKTTKLLCPKGDWDNYVKGVQDAMNGVCFTDDTLVTRGQAEKLWVTGGEPARIMVYVEEL